MSSSSRTISSSSINRSQGPSDSGRPFISEHKALVNVYNMLKDLCSVIDDIRKIRSIITAMHYMFLLTSKVQQDDADDMDDDDDVESSDSEYESSPPPPHPPPVQPNPSNPVNPSIPVKKKRPYGTGIIVGSTTLIVGPSSSLFPVSPNTLTYRLLMNLLMNLLAKEHTSCAEKLGKGIKGPNILEKHFLLNPSIYESILENDTYLQTLRSLMNAKNEKKTSAWKGEYAQQVSSAYEEFIKRCGDATFYDAAVEALRVPMRSGHALITECKCTRTISIENRNNNLGEWINQFTKAINYTVGLYRKKQNDRAGGPSSMDVPYEYDEIEDDDEEEAHVDAIHAAGMEILSRRITPSTTVLTTPAQVSVVIPRRIAPTLVSPATPGEPRAAVKRKPEVEAEEVRKRAFKSQHVPPPFVGGNADRRMASAIDNICRRHTGGGVDVPTLAHSCIVVLGLLEKHFGENASSVYPVIWNTYLNVLTL